MLRLMGVQIKGFLTAIVLIARKASSRQQLVSR